LAVRFGRLRTNTPAGETLFFRAFSSRFFSTGWRIVAESKTVTMTL
jgi:hypothetical protein